MIYRHKIIDNSQDSVAQEIIKLAMDYMEGKDARDGC
jgi:hypothetical protein